MISFYVMMFGVPAAIIALSLILASNVTFEELE